MCIIYILLLNVSICAFLGHTTLLGLRKPRKLIHSIETHDIELAAEAGPLLVVQHGPGEGRGRAVRSMEMVHRDFNLLGFTVKKMEFGVDGVVGDLLGQWVKEVVGKVVDGVVGPQVNLYFRQTDTSYPGEFGHHEQLAVLRWALKRWYCLEDKVVAIGAEQIEVLTRYLRTWSVIYSYGRQKSEHLFKEMDQQVSICKKTGGIMLFKALGDLAPAELHLPLQRGPALVLHAHNVPLVYTGDMSAMHVLAWLHDTHRDDSGIITIGTNNLHRIVALERTVFVVFHLNSVTETILTDKSSSARLQRLGVVGVAVENVGEVSELGAEGVEKLPALVMFKHGLPVIYPGHLTPSSLDQLFAWVERESGRKEKVVITGVSSLRCSEDAPCHHLMVKPHSDALQKLSVEYARLMKENKRLKKVISDAREVLGDGEVAETPNDGGVSESSLRAECWDCIGSVGQAIWDCGTLDIDCIKNCIDATSLCYGCICEILDYWWAKDAPNCYKKEIVSVIEKDNNNTEESETTVVDTESLAIDITNVQKEEL